MKKFDFNSLTDLDDLIAEGNRELIASGGPQKDTPEEIAQLERAVAQIKRRNRANGGQKTVTKTISHQKNPVVVDQ